VRLKQNAAENLREKEAIRPKRLCGCENEGAKENEIGALRAEVKQPSVNVDIQDNQPRTKSHRE